MYCKFKCRHGAVKQLGENQLTNDHVCQNCQNFFYEAVGLFENWGQNYASSAIAKHYLSQFQNRLLTL